MRATAATSVKSRQARPESGRRTWTSHRTRRTAASSEGVTRTVQRSVFVSTWPPYDTLTYMLGRVPWPLAA